MIAHQVVSGPGHQCNQLADEVEWREQHVGGAVPEGMFELILHLPVGTQGQAVEADGGPGHVAAQTLEFVTLVWLAGDGGVQ